MEQINRCPWCEKDDLYRNYHDNEWGIPIFDDTVLFEYLVLESFQAGLSWHSILKKRENFRKAFDYFNYKKIQYYDDKKITELLQNEGIIRNKLKILATINNSKTFIKIQNEFGSFAEYIWNFTQGKTIFNNPESPKNIPATTPLSDKISKDLKKRGFKFLGSTTIYAFMQAVGIVNDHLTTCHKGKKI
jgi:DNA-3-methyladenine glycosylase I